MVTSEQLIKLSIDEKWLMPLNDTFKKFEINTSLRMACFIGQVKHESGFVHLEENLNYSAIRMTQVWSRITLAQATTAVAKGKDAVAELIYGGRKELGNTIVGDGGKFYGRGLIQLTGRANYTAFATAIEEPKVIENPELLTKPEYACLSAGWFWNTRKLNTLADIKDYTTMTRRINGGILGLEERIKHIDEALLVFA